MRVIIFPIFDPYDIFRTLFGNQWKMLILMCDTLDIRVLWVFFYEQLVREISINIECGSGEKSEN